MSTMRLLVACNYLLLIDAQTRDCHAVSQASKGYYGVSWTTDGEELVFGNAGQEPGTTLEDCMDAEVGYLTIGARRGVECLSGPHQVLCTEDRVLIAHTGRNCLTVVRRDDLFFRHVWVDNARWDRKGDNRPIGQHLNSVTVVGDRLYLLAHNFYKGSRIAELTWPGLELVRWIETKGSQAHNVWVQPNGELLICNTFDASLIEAVSGRILWKARGETTGLSRGLACAGGYVFVGMSQRASRKERGSTDGGVWVLDRATWKEIDFIPLPASGNVKEVRIVDEPDECHHGHILRNVPVPLEGPTAEYRSSQALRANARGPWTVRSGAPALQGGALEVGSAGELTLATVAGSAADVRVSARLEATPQPDHRHAGLIARYSGPNDLNMVCALVEVVSPYPFASLWENVGREWKQLARVRIGRLPAEVRLEASGPQLRLFVDGRSVLTAKTQVLAAGAVGIRGTTGRYGGFAAEAVLPSGQRQPLFAA
jgi:hypothetical protein